MNSLKNKIKIKAKHLIAIALAIGCLAPSLFNGAAVYAQGSIGGGGDGGGNPSCYNKNGSPKWFSTCTGTGWYYYEGWSGPVHVPGYVQNGVARDYARAGTIYGCEGAAGYWRYSAVHHYTGEQVGLKAIGGTSLAWRADKLANGQLHNYEYYADRGYTWEAAKTAYADAWNKAAHIFKERGYHQNEFDIPNSTLSWFCAWDTPPEPDGPEEAKPVSHSCPAELPGLGEYFHSENIGNSIALSAVANLSKKEGWDVHTSRNGDNITYARPGDSIQFKHTYCYAASLVKNREHWALGTGGREFITARNYFKITALRNDFPNRNYRFGGPEPGTKLQDGIFDGVIKIELTGPGKAENLEDKVDVNSDNGFTTLSPANNAGDRYDCKHKTFLLNNFKTPGYQVNGFTHPDPECKSYTEVHARDVGSVITQTLDWTNTRAWIKEVHEFDGECNCEATSSVDDRTVITEPLDGWPGFDPDDAVGGARFPSGHGCYQNGQCNQDKNCQDVEDDPKTPEDETFECDKWDSYSDSPTEYRYPLAYEETGDFETEIVNAVIPYNYDTWAESSIESGDTNYIGEYVKTRFNWGLVGRDNPDVFEEPYATISRPTRIQLVEFMVYPHIMGDDSKVSGQNDYTGGDVCSFYRQPSKLSAYWCKPISDFTTTLNEEGSYAGREDYGDDPERRLPDVEPGTKYCVAMGIWPADSHDKPNVVLGAGANPIGSPAVPGDKEIGGVWRISNASCRTLHKKPNFQVWGAGIFTNAGITTSVSKKSPGEDTPRDWKKSDPTHTFGSWDEYAVISKGTVKRFASAAGYGYQNGLLLYPTGGAKGNADFCSNLSRLTLGSCDKDKSTAGPAQVSLNETIIERLKSRYTLSSKEINSIPIDTSLCHRIDYSDDGNPNNDYKNLATCGVVSTSNMTYIRAKADIATSSTIIAHAGSIDDNGISDNRGTIVIDATGHDITINSNICYLDGDCNNNTLNDVKLRSDATSVDNIAVLPQVLIFADNIKISPNVSQIDAWLIADNEINTCNTFVNGTTDTLQCNKILTVNGPVFANTLSLNRTAGADPGKGSITGDDAGLPHTHNLANDGSITPAEIFNLRPDTYYWAYSQAQRFSQAVVTYSRELAPRY